MPSVLKLIELSTDYLSQKGIESPRLNAELLLAHVMNCKRLELYLLFERPLTKDEIDSYRELLKRRGNFEPLQYITGSVDFYGINLKVNKNVLIPRPETELLVESVINLTDNNSEINILDIGCGSGNIAIALAKNISNSLITTIDISEEAINLAKENASDAGIINQLKFINGDIRSEFNNISNLFDIIVSNPPYVSATEYNNLQKEILNFEPKEAVTDFDDGYSYFKSITEIAAKLLKNGRKLFFEIGKDQSENVINIMKQNGFTNIKIIKDYQQIDRIIYGVKE